MDEVDDAEAIVQKLSQFTLPTINTTELEELIRESMNAEGKEAVKQMLGLDVSELRPWIEDLSDYLEISLQTQDCTTYLQSVCEKLPSRAVLLLFHRCLQEERNAALAGLSACAYINFVRLPGSVSYQIFHPIMFRQALKNLSTVLRNSVAPAEKKKKKKAPGKKRKAVGDEDDSMSSSFSLSQSQDEQDIESSQSEDPKVFKKLCDSSVVAIHGLLASFPLSAYPDSILTCIDTLVDLSLVKMEDSGQPTRRRQSVENSVSIMCYSCLESLLDTKHGDPNETLKNILKALLSGVFMNFRNTNEFKEMNESRQNAIKMIRKLGGNADYVESLTALVHHISIKSPERAELRTFTSDLINSLLQIISAENTYIRYSVFLRKLGRNPKMNTRLFAVEMAASMLPAIDSWKESSLTPQKQGTIENLMALIWERCSDKGTNIRSKALSIFSSVFSDFFMTDKLTKEIDQAFLFDRASSKSQDDSDILEELDPATEIDFLGNPEGPLQKSTLDVQALLSRRLNDEKWSVRKSAVQAFASFTAACCKKFGAVNPAKLSVFKDRSSDLSMSVRKQAISSLTELFLQFFALDDVVSGYWVTSVLPLILDSEHSMQEKCVEQFDEVVLKRIEHKLVDDSVWLLISKIDEESSRYIQRILQALRKAGRNMDKCIRTVLNKAVESDDRGLWKFLQELSGAYPQSIDVKKLFGIWEKIEDAAGAHLPGYVQMLLSVISNCRDSVNVHDASSLSEKLAGRILQFDFRLEHLGIIHCMIQAIQKLNERKSASGSESLKELFCKIISVCDDVLYRYVTKPDQQIPAESMAIYLYISGEISLISPHSITKRYLTFIQSLNTPTINLDLSRYGEEAMNDSQQLSTPIRLSIPPVVRAHALVALGKFCLSDQGLAKKCIAAFARELQTTNDSVVRNNIIVILSDFCVKYASMVEPYVQHLAGCFKDPAPFLRKQSLILVTRLLQEDFLKWKGVLIFRYLVTLIDEDASVRELAHTCLIHTLLKKTPALFFSHFIETIFHLNDYQNHAMYNQFTQSQRDRLSFSLKQHPKKREEIYRIMLENMTDEQKFHLQGKLCQDVLGGLCDGALIFDSSHAILQDALIILSSKDIKLSCFKKQADDMDEEPVNAALTAARNHILSQISKKNLMENIIPVVIELKHFLEKKHSPLLKNLMMYLKDLMKEYRDEVTDILAADRQLAAEVEYDLRMLEQSANQPTTPLTPKSPMAQPQPQPQVQVPQNAQAPIATSSNQPATPTKAQGNQIFSPSRSPLGSIPRLRRSSVEGIESIPAMDPGSMRIGSVSKPAAVAQTPKGTRSSIVSRWRKSSPWRSREGETHSPIAASNPPHSPSVIRLQPIEPQEQDDVVVLIEDEERNEAVSSKVLHKILNFDAEQGTS